MNAAYALAFLITQPSVKDLGNPDWRVRNAQHDHLGNMGVWGLAVAGVNTTHSDPEIRARCRKLLDDSKTWLVARHRVVAIVVVLWPDDLMDTEELWYRRWRFPKDIADFITGYVDKHPITFAESIGSKIRNGRGANYDDPVTDDLKKYRDNIRPWRNW